MLRSLDIILVVSIIFILFIRLDNYYCCAQHQQQIHHTLQFPTPPNNNISPNLPLSRPTSSSSTTSCQYIDPSIGCTTCSELIDYVKRNVSNVLQASQVGCKNNYDCSIQSVSTLCGEVCLQPMLTSKAHAVATILSNSNRNHCESTLFQSTCNSFITRVTQPNTSINTGSNSNNNNLMTCIDQIAYCSNGICQQRNKLVAAATEIFATPIDTAGIGSNGVTGLFINPDSIWIATSKVPIPTVENVLHVIDNVKFPHQP